MVVVMWIVEVKVPVVPTVTVTAAAKVTMTVSATVTAAVALWLFVIPTAIVIATAMKRMQRTIERQDPAGSLTIGPLHRGRSHPVRDPTQVSAAVGPGHREEKHIKAAR